MGCVVTYQPLLPDLNKAKGPIAGSRRVAGAHQDHQMEMILTKSEVFRRQTDASVWERTHPVARDTLYSRYIKRALDITYAMLAAPIVVPIVLLLCLLIARDGANPLYSQLRVGQNGQIFRMWKLRSMVPDAEQELARHLESDASARAEWALKQKLAVDPRVTRIGRLIRKTSLDELPQLYNVLVGDMSLVGPRPMMVDQTKLYRGTLYYALRPGLTGLWQVSARNQSAFAERERYDDAYARQIGFGLDMKLMLLTLKVVFAGTGR